MVCWVSSCVLNIGGHYLYGKVWLCRLDLRLCFCNLQQIWYEVITVINNNQQSRVRSTHLHRWRDLGQFLTMGYLQTYASSTVLVEKLSLRVIWKDDLQTALLEWQTPEINNSKRFKSLCHEKTWKNPNCRSITVAWSWLSSLWRH